MGQETAVKTNYRKTIVGLCFGLGALSSMWVGLPSSASAGSQDPKAVQSENAPGPKKEQPAPKPEFEPPAKRRAIAGMGSVSGRTALTFPSQPEVTYEFDFTYVFPDRVRWRMAPQTKVSAKKQKGRRTVRTQEETTATRQTRRLMYRYGSGAWTVEPGKTSSDIYRDEELRVTLLQFELRRIALIWPGELKWQAKDNGRTAQLEGLGQIEVQLDPVTQLPLLFRSVDPDGSTREELTHIVWQPVQPDSKGPPSPQSWQLHFEGNHVWSEQFEFVKRGLKFNDAYFRPVDRRKRGRTSVSGSDGLDRIDLPQVAVWREPLTAQSKADWTVAIQQAKAAMERWRPILKEREMVLDEWPVFHLNALARPTLLELRLKSMPDFPPEKWFPQGGLPALRLVLLGFDQVSPETVKRMQSRIPAGHHGASAYVAVQITDSGVGLTQMVLPLIDQR